MQKEKYVPPSEVFRVTNMSEALAEAAKQGIKPGSVRYSQSEVLAALRDIEVGALAIEAWGP